MRACARRLARFAPSKNWCWRQELNPQPFAYEALALPLCYASNPHSASPETSARVGSTGRGSAVCRGALSLKTLSFTQGRSHARTPSGANGYHARTPLRARACAGLRLRSLTGGVVGHSVPLPVMAEGLWPAAG